MKNTDRCSTVHPKFGRCIEPRHDASKPTAPHNYDFPKTTFDVAKHDLGMSDAEAFEAEEIQRNELS